MSSEPEPGVGETEAAPSGLISLGLPVAPHITHFNEEDDDDVHKCGRCQTEFTSLEEFVQHKIQKVCQRSLEHTLESSISVLSTQEQVVPSIEDPVSISHIIVESSSLPEDMSNAPELASAELKHMLASEDSIACDQRSEVQELEVEWHESPAELAQGEEGAAVKMVVDEQGRYICQMCQKTFKTSNILKAHLLTHSNKKDFECKLCGNAFRTKGSLIRHNRRHTDERPYVCSKCGKSFRESGALSRHMRSLTPCTEKISLNMGKGIVINRDENSSDLVSTDTSSQLDDVDTTPMIRLVTDDKGNLLHEVHVQVQTLAIKPGTEVLLGNDTEDFTCPQCGDICKSSNSLKIHMKGHEGCKLYRCEECGREFLKAHLLRKHQESHVDIRKYKCGECGKMYKTVAHAKGHMRVHSDDRPYPCSKCGKRYKTKNAQQVHFRTHLSEKPFVCQFCPHSFREKGSLVRHIRHHTGEKPFKCQKCGRGFAEHGTLNRHLKTKGGCVVSNQMSVQNMSENSSSSETMTTTMISEDPHTVLVEFSSVVADTQEYIIEASEDLESSEAAELLQSTGTHEVDSHILKVVQQIVSTASPGQQIIVQNVTLDDSTEPCMEEVPTTDTITIASPESLTEQVALTLASAIGNGTVVTSEASTEEELMVQQDVEMEEQVGEFVITTSQDGEVEVQTVIV